MKGDFSRQTFDPTRHYRGVRIQQGRVQLDADWNEQTDIADHIAAATAGDTIGPCGAPEGLSAFHVVVDVKDLTAQEKKLPQNTPADPVLKPGDFFLSAGHYYVGGILCENDRIVSYGAQPDLPGAKLLPQGEKGVYVVYLDVWQRHVTAIDDPRLREVALGGPDTATRARTVWQVKVWPTGTATGDCGTEFKGFEELLAPPTGTLSARPRTEPATTDPCLVPPGAGYRGPENQLYRVEAHTGGKAFDVSAGVDETPVTAVTGTNKVRFASSFAVANGAAIELFRPADPMNAQIAFVTDVANVDAQTVEATLSTDVAGLTLADNPRLRRAAAVFKWSRDNGSVVTTITKIDGVEVSVHDLGPDDVLGFGPGQWVEISDDTLELNGASGPLVQIAKVVPGQPPTVTLKSPPVATTGANPKLRRWDGAAAIKVNKAAPEKNWMELESGVQIQFSDGTYRAHDYWLIPARAASADAESGSLDWPRTKQGNTTVPAALAPAGIKHHYCKLAVVHFDGAKITGIDDCRPLFPPLTDLTTLVYVGGDGQEAMPGDPLPQLLQAGVFNGRRAVKGRKVRFTAGDGKVAGNTAGLPAATAVFDATTGADGLANCAWLPDPAVLNQQVEARLLDAAGNPLPPLLHFDAQLSVASQVAYDPATCPDLKAAQTVQQAIDLLCKRSHGGCEVVVGEGGQFATIGEAIKVLIAQKRFDICLCLMRGNFLVGPADLSPLQAGDIVRLSVAGCGRGSVVVFDGEKVVLSELESLTLRTLTLEFAQPLTVQFGNDVVIDSCHVIGAAPATVTPLQIDKVARVRLTNNLIEARGVAVAITGADGNVLIENNVFLSPLSLYGLAAPDKRKPLNVDEMSKVGSKAREVLSFVPATGMLQLRGNRLSQVLVGDDMLAAIRALVGNESKLGGLYRAAHVDNNLFGATGNELAAFHLTLTANSFLPPSSQGELGFAVMHRAAFVANLGPGVNGSARFRFAAREAVLQDALQFEIPGPPKQTIRISAGNVGMHFQA